MFWVGYEGEEKVVLLEELKTSEKALDVTCGGLTWTSGYLHGFHWASHEVVDCNIVIFLF